MAQVYFEITGNGYAYVIPSEPSVGEEFEFNAVAYDGDSFVDVTCTDDGGYSVAVPQSPQFNLIMPSTQFLTFHVEFTGVTPPPPTPERPKRKRMPLWMYPCLRG